VSLLTAFLVNKVKHYSTTGWCTDITIDNKRIYSIFSGPPCTRQVCWRNKFDRIPCWIRRRNLMQCEMYVSMTNRRMCYALLCNFFRFVITAPLCNYFGSHCNAWLTLWFFASFCTCLFSLYSQEDNFFMIFSSCIVVVIIHLMVTK